MTYFSRRNEYLTEYSGHEEATKALRDRIMLVISEFVKKNPIRYNSNLPVYVDPDNFTREVQKEFPKNNPSQLINEGLFREVFTVIEIFLDLTRNIHYTRKEKALLEKVILKPLQILRSLATQLKNY